jgi:hypothetical protein
MIKEYFKKGQFKIQDCAIFLEVDMYKRLNGVSYDLIQNKNCVNVNFLKFNNDTVH